MSTIEPARTKEISTLAEPFRSRVKQLIAAMTAHGYDPVVFEARRSAARQQYLYGFGRTHHVGKRPVTWTLKSRHLTGTAVDIISKSRLWSWPGFYDALKHHAEALGLHVLNIEQCHVQADP